MNYTKQQLIDYFEWDIVNWSKSLKIWDKHISKNKLTCLELGGRGGGLSLYLAKKGHNVICSDLENPKEVASILHSKNKKVTNLIKYEAIDATLIPYEDYFDIIIFKSVLGGVGRNDNYEAQKKMIEQIHKALKKNGVLLFAENLTGSKIHSILRQKFNKWSNYWRYITKKETKNLFSNFDTLEYKTCGFLGTFGRNNWQRNILGKIDSLIFDKILNHKNHYIIYGAVKK